MSERLTILAGDCRETLKTLPDESVNCCVTSPPYFNLRCYGHEKQMGRETSPKEFVDALVGLFQEVKRVLRNDGTLWLNLGDSYAANRSYQVPSTKGGPKHSPAQGESTNNIVPDGLKSKDLIGIPWRVAFALQADGWYLRQDIIWHKPNPMPESVTDRCTKSHEYIFLLSKSARYFYDADAIKTPLKDTSVARLIQDVENQEGSDRVPGKTNGKMKAVRFGGNKQCPDTRLQSGKEWNPKMAGGGTSYKNGHSGYFSADGSPMCGVMANKKSVWTVTTRPYKGAHFATFPPELIRPCILAGCPKDGVVLDPFGGSGTTGMVALQEDRRAVLCELNPEYVPLIHERCDPLLAPPPVREPDLFDLFNFA